MPNSNTTQLKEMIIQVVAKIPPGKVTSYGKIARLCGYSGHARYVGTVLKQLPKDTKLPWHRVINSKGEIAFPAGSPAYTRQYSLLTKEGIIISNGKISMSSFGWSGELILKRS